ncbi:MAG TPA: HAMP domain-containing sensor histidine kinase [Fibrobacteria bacterium]|nr:HAMP domain-containing sensor histidine kinase [Fibrobacteria bacterium]
MPERRVPSLARSLFLRLPLVLLAAAVLVNLCVGGFFRWMFGGEEHAAARRNLLHYGELLVREAGSPPDTARAWALARAYALQIRYEGPGGTWETAPGLAELAGRRPRHGWSDDGDDRIGWSRGRMYVRVEKSGARWIFATDFRQGSGSHWPAAIGVLALVSFILLGAWLVIRRMLAPIRDLAAGVERLGRGDLGSTVPDCGRKDELGELARAFNAMSARLASLVRGREQLLLDVSHELRSPMTRIQVALEMTPESGARDSIREDLAEMNAMIGEILEAARLDSPAGRLNLKETDLAGLLREVVRGFEGRAPGVRLSVPGAGGEGEACLAEVDPERARKVLGNVLDNALKYSGSGAGPVEARLEAGRDEVVVTVVDRGAGIPADEIPRLFEPFYRVDRSRSRDTGGYGLGLSLCKRIMEAHGGRIVVASREGEGTTVLLAFPRRDQTPI